MSIKKSTIYLYNNGKISTPSERGIAEEVPVALIYNGIAHTVMMALPQDLAQFAIGFSLSEQIISHVSDIYGIDIKIQSAGIEVAIELSSRRFAQLKHRRRTLAGRTGCGICGMEQLDEIYQPLPLLPFTQSLPLSSLLTLRQDIVHHQAIGKITGCTHAAAWVDNDGNILACFEDIGRHVALDKLLGKKTSQPWQQGAVVISSRASYEMIKKTITCGIEILLSFSTTTSLAIEFAQKYQLTLAQLCRDNTIIIYTHPERITA